VALGAAHVSRWLLDPLFRGAYLDGFFGRLGAAAPPVEDGDLEAIAAPIDFLGVNYYTRQLVGARPRHVVRPSDAVYTDMDWEVYPDGLVDLLVRLKDDYAPRAIHITENGAAFGDVRGHDGRVLDPERQAYI